MASDSLKQERIIKLLTVLKERDQQFQQEKQELRADFLVRGICEKEVDGLLDDPSLFPKTWLPWHLRWDAICSAGENLAELLLEAEKLVYGETSAHINLAQARTFITKSSQDGNK